MNLKEEYNSLVKLVKQNIKKAGGKITGGEMAERLNISRTYLSGLLGGSKEVTKKHIDDFKSHFRDELNGIIKPSLPSEIGNRERAIIKMLFQRLAKSESERLGIPIDKVLDEMERDTMLAWRDLESEDKV